MEKVNYSAMTDKELKAYIANKLQTDNAWLRRGITAIYNRQTESEQLTGETTVHNGQGFSGKDAPFMTSIAKKIAGGLVLSAKQLEVSRKIMASYAGQLARIVRESHPKESPTPKLSDLSIPNKSGLTNGQEYDLGGSLGLYDEKHDCFHVGNSVIYRYDSIYW